EIMIHELTLRAWMHAEENKRRTLQRSDIASAITKTDMFDFLIDIVPREETVRATPTKSSDKPDFHSNLPHTNPHYSYMTTQFPQGHQYATADQSQIPPAGQSGLPQQQLMQMQYLRNQLMQQPPTPSGVNPGQSPIQGSQPGMLQGQGAQGFYSQPYATYQGQQGVAGSQPLMSPQHQRGGQQHYGNPPHQ
ncbi:CCAAT- binding transcription factor component, partial [Tieghemiomyces parasiticus]